ncbi:hypothetical protein DM02DRAFT_540897, partial [Periconia macrospinosa]
PISRETVDFTQQITNPPLRNRILTLIEVATTKPDVSHFIKATLKNPAHKSNSDPKEHVTVRLATEEEESRGVAQTTYIHFNRNGRYDGHRLFPEHLVKEKAIGWVTW